MMTRSTLQTARIPLLGGRTVKFKSVWRLVGVALFLIFGVNRFWSSSDQDYYRHLPSPAILHSMPAEAKQYTYSIFRSATCNCNRYDSRLAPHLNPWKETPVTLNAARSHLRF